MFFLNLLAIVQVLAITAFPDGSAPAIQPLRTQNVVLVMCDGLRWQEVFSGIDVGLANAENHVGDVEALKKEYWRESPEARREALMPFLWKDLVPSGQIYGNREKGSEANITNGIGVSYPGYSETLCGFAEPAIKGNSKVWNPNPTVLEWLHGKPEFAGKVAAFGAWDMFTYIFNTQRCGFPVDNGCGPITAGKTTPTIEVMNRVRAETPYRWNGAPFDSMVFIPALDWIKANRPRVVFLGLGETDEWAHECRYADYLHAASRADGYIKELWSTLQSMPEYRGTTTLIVCPDHGRGDIRGPEPKSAEQDWCNHGPKHPGSEAIWIAVIGPDTPTLGERGHLAPVTQSQIAATMAALLGQDFAGTEPRAGKPLADVIGGR